MQATPKTFHASSLATLTLAFAACGGLSGTYSGKETGFLYECGLGYCREHIRLARLTFETLAAE
jgi:hypothetical protein